MANTRATAQLHDFVVEAMVCVQDAWLLADDQERLEALSSAMQALTACLRPDDAGAPPLELVSEAQAATVIGAVTLEDFPPIDMDAL